MEGDGKSRTAYGKLLSVKKNNTMICIVDGDTTYLDTLRFMLNKEPGLEVTGYYENAKEALRKIKWEQTDILLTDLDLPGMPGLEFIRHASARCHNIRIMVYTHKEDRNAVLEAIRAGASGYVLKSCPYSKLIMSLHDIYHGHIPVSPSISRMLLRELQITPANPCPDANQCALSTREQEILKYLSQGMTYKEISTRLFIVTSTVCSHVKHIYAKLKAHNRQEALRKARYHGFL